MGMCRTIVSYQCIMSLLNVHFLVKHMEKLVPETAEHPRFIVVMIIDREICWIDFLPAESLWGMCFTNNHQLALLTTIGVDTVKGGYSSFIRFTPPSYLSGSLLTLE